MNKPMKRTMHKRIQNAILTACFFLCSASTAFAESFDMDFATVDYLSRYAGDLPYSAYDYASNPGRGSVDRDVMVDPDYSFRVVLDYDKDGVNDLASRTTYTGKTENYTWKDVNYKAFNLKKNSANKPKIRYSKLLLYKKQWIDVETSIVDWDCDDESKAYISGGFVETNLFHVNWVKMVHRFYIAGTNKPVEINGFLTYEDVDLKQGISLLRSEVDKLWCNVLISNGGQGSRLRYAETDSLLKIKDTSNYDAPDVVQTEEDRLTASKAVFSYTFHGSSHTQYLMDARTVASRRSLFGFSAAKMIPSALPEEDVITKTIRDGDEEEVQENTIHKPSEEWTYYVNAPVPMETETANFIDGLTMEDQIDGCLEVLDAEVFRGADENVTSQFNVSIEPAGSETSEGTIVSASAKNAKRAAFHGYTYSLAITVRVKAKEMRLKDHGHFNEESGSYQFVNQGEVVFKVDDQNYTSKTNETTTTLQVPWSKEKTPGLKILKTTSKRLWHVGNMIDYTITVQNKNPDAVAENVVIEDYDLPDYLRLEESTLKITGCQGTISKVDNGFKAEIGELTSEQTAKITFQAKAEPASCYWNIENTAIAKADLVPETSSKTDVFITDNKSDVCITKQIDAKDLYSYHGTPVFIFRLSGVTDEGEEKEYYRIIEFPSSQDLSENGEQSDLTEGEDGCVQKTVVFQNISPGVYKCEEIEADRFTLDGIKDVSDNGTIKGDYVRFHLTDAQEGKATFVNKKTNWSGYSDSQCVTNTFGSEVM